MTRDVARALLAELAERGVHVRIEDGRIHCKPRRGLTDELRQRLLRHRDEVLAELAVRECPVLEAVLEAFDGQIVGADAWGESAPFWGGYEQPGTCRLCGGREWWRRRAGGPVVCQRCHECPYGDAVVERWTTEGDSR